MADFVLGRLKFTFKGAWAPSTAYVADDIVRYGGKSYVCIGNHVSSSGDGFYLDSAYWSVMTSGTEWKGDWTPSTYYKIDDIVKYGGRVYVANVGHSSAASTALGLESNQNNWVLFSSTPSFVGDWSANVRYKIDDVVQFGNSLYRVTNAHFSNATTSSNVATWNTHEGNVELFLGGLEFEDTYQANVEYQTGDIVRYGGYNFIAKDESIGNLPTNTTYWDVLSTGFKHRGAYNNATAYEPGDVVTYGAYSYVAKLNSTGNLPTNVTYWDLITSGFVFKGDYDNSTAYVPGDVVKYGASTFVATVAGTGVVPTSNANWSSFTQGVRYRGNYSNVATYLSGDIVKYGAYQYQANATISGIVPTSNANWILTSTGLNWANTWSGVAVYQLGDVVNYANSSYVSITSDNSNVIPSTANSESSWQLVAQGAMDNFTVNPGDIPFRGNVGLTAISIAETGKVLTSNGAIPVWEYDGYLGNVIYVAPEGQDATGYGKTLNRPYRTVKHAANVATANSTIFVKSGYYEEQLPITIPAGVAIVGDNQRTVTIAPAAGLSDDLVNQNNTSTMFYLSDASLLTRVTMKGMTGWTANAIETSNLISTFSNTAGVFVRLNPSSNVLTKSPYVLECSAISEGGIGALVDGSVHAVGNKSMIFHAYTVINSDGIGYWVKDNARAEIVSCFTYYCTFGYATTGGGVIRALNGNNSYGKYGAYSQGFDATEIPLGGNVYGDLINLTPGTVSGGFSTGDTITGNTSGATAVITNSQIAGDKLYVKRLTSNVFFGSEVITSNAGGLATITNSGNTLGQSGFLLVANSFVTAPIPGSSIQIDNDNVSYIVQSVSGTFLDANSILTVVLTQEKPTVSPEGTGLTIRRKYSQARLTGHDFLNIGTGNVYTTNYPGVSIVPAAQGNEVLEEFPGRVFYVSTDQDGNFRVGDYFRVDQATGTATLNASAFNLAGLTSLRLGSIGAQLGETINEFSADSTLGGASNQAVPTEFAVKSYVDNKFNSLSVALSVALSL